MKPDDKLDFFDTSQLAAWLGVSTRSVERMRADETGPPVTYVRGRARYDKELARAWARASDRRSRKLRQRRRSFTQSRLSSERDA